MNERTDLTEIHYDRLRTPEIIAAEQVEALLFESAADSQILLDKRFSTGDEAQESAKTLSNKTIDMLNAIGGLEKLPITFFGPGVHTPLFNMEKVTNTLNSTRGLYVSIDDTRPMIEVEPFDYVNGTIRSFNTLIKNHDDGSYQAKPSLVIMQSGSKRDEITVSVGGEYPFVHVEARPLALIELNADMRFTIDNLEAYRRKIENKTYERAYKKTSTGRARLSRYLGKLSSAIYNEKEGEFIDLKKPKIIREIGALAAVYAKSGNDEAEIISRVILNKIGYGRQLLIEHEVVTEDSITKEKVHGHLLEVIIPNSAGNIEQPVLVLDEEVDGEVGEGIHYVPFERIKSLRF